MNITIKNLDELKFMPGNTRLHSERQIREYCRSIKMFGQLRPMVVDENNTVLAGNGLLEAMRKLGITQGVCHVVTGLTENMKKKLMLADNRIAELGEEDRFAFEEALSQLGSDIDIPGYGIDILKNLAADLKSIENLDAGEEKKTRPRKAKTIEQIICPHCGFKFNRGDTQCREKQDAPADTKVALA